MPSLTIDLPFQKDLLTRTLFQGWLFSSCSKGWQERRTCPLESSNLPFCHELIREKSVQLAAHVHIWTQVMWWTLRSFWFQSEQRTAAWWKSDGLKGCVWCFGMFSWISWVKPSAAKRLRNAALSSIVAIATKKPKKENRFAHVPEVEVDKTNGNQLKTTKGKTKGINF